MVENHSNGIQSIRMPIPTIRLGFEAFECQFLPFDWDSKHSNANSNHSNGIRSIRMPIPTIRKGFEAFECQLKLCSLYKIVHNMTHFPPDIVVPKVTRSYTSTPFTLYQPFAHTNCFFSSFVPHAVSHWNSLPESVVSSPSFATFKHSLTMYHMH